MTKCASCPGVAHPATGHQHSPSTLICAGCARAWFAWLQMHTHVKFRVGPKGSKVFVPFYGREDAGL